MKLINTNRATIAAALLAALVSSAAADEIRYQIIDLGAVPWLILDSRAYDVNAAGEVVGASLVNFGDRAIRAGASDTPVQLGDFDGGRADSSAFGINDLGEIVGFATDADGFRAALWPRQNDPVKLRMLDDGSDFISYAYAINNYGLIVGGVTYRPAQLQLPAYWPTLDTIVVLNDLPLEYPTGLFISVNDHGEAVGLLRNAVDDLPRGFRWTQDGGLALLEDLPGGALESRANDINDLGQIVGYSNGPDGDRAVIWDPQRGLLNLGALPRDDDQDPYSHARGINNYGTVVGETLIDGGLTGFVWDFRNGMRDLRTLATADSAPIAIESARAINDDGVIVAYGLLPSRSRRACLLKPIRLGCAADLTGDNVVDGEDLAQLFDCWGLACGDLTGDAQTALDDLAALLADWSCGLTP